MVSVFLVPRAEQFSTRLQRVSWTKLGQLNLRLRLGVSLYTRATPPSGTIWGGSRGCSRPCREGGRWLDGCFESCNRG